MKREERKKLRARLPYQFQTLEEWYIYDRLNVRVVERTNLSTEAGVLLDFIKKNNRYDDRKVMAYIVNNGNLTLWGRVSSADLLEICNCDRFYDTNAKTFNRALSLTLGQGVKQVYFTPEMLTAAAKYDRNPKEVDSSILDDSATELDIYLLKHGVSLKNY